MASRKISEYSWVLALLYHLMMKIRPKLPNGLKVRTDFLRLSINDKYCNVILFLVSFLFVFCFLFNVRKWNVNYQCVTIQMKGGDLWNCLILRFSVDRSKCTFHNEGLPYLPFLCSSPGSCYEPISSSLTCDKFSPPPRNCLHLCPLCIPIL